jgi:major type 1 subunit fimbrin (pilin)
MALWLHYHLRLSLFFIDALNATMKQTLIHLLRIFFFSGRLQAIKPGPLCRAALVALICMKCGTAAALTCENSGDWSRMRIIAGPEKITMLPGDPIGTQLTWWHTGPELTQVFLCSNQGIGGALTYVGIGSWLPGITVDNYPVFSTNLAGIGIAFSGRVWVNNNFSGWNENQNLPILASLGRAYVAQSPAPVGTVVSYTLVKTVNGPVQTGVIPSDYSKVQFGPAEYRTLEPAGGSWSPQFLELSPIAIVEPSCQVQDMTVHMGSVSGSEFHGQGSVAGTQAFNITLTDCPAGYNTIQYTLHPLTAIIDREQSVIALQAGGASGVGLQLQNDQGPVPFDQAISFPYTSGTLSIPLKAAYYQTAPAITSGEAKAAVEFSITYQ